MSSKQNLRVALLADELTRTCLSFECTVLDVPTRCFGSWLRKQKPDFLLVESAWSGLNNQWKFKIANYPDHRLRNNWRLRWLVWSARNQGIPTVFWNKEDGVHFDRFIDSARRFDHVFTVDVNCVPRYRAVMGQNASVHVLPFPVQPRIHHFTGFNFSRNDAAFVGSYTSTAHSGRCAWQRRIFSAALESGLGLTVYDRNSQRPSKIYRYPSWPKLVVKPAVSHTDTHHVYKDHLVSLNVNTVTDSETMYSRRLVEILACGGIAVTSPARSVDAMFAPYCHVVETANETKELFARLRYGPLPSDLERARAGSEYVLKHHTWANRVEQIANAVL
jgi:spore maturation protein CgeB